MKKVKNFPITESSESRFWAKVDVRGADDCWLWTGSKTKKGYGKLGFYRLGWVFAHRFSFLLHGGEITENKPFILHSCDTPACQNPRHLRSGDSKDNLEEMSLKGRSFCQQKTHCPQGHPYSGENLYIQKSNHNARRCRTCMASQAKQRRLAHA